MSAQLRESLCEHLVGQPEGAADRAGGQGFLKNRRLAVSAGTFEQFSGPEHQTLGEVFGVMFGPVFDRKSKYGNFLRRERFLEEKWPKKHNKNKAKNA